MTVEGVDEKGGFALLHRLARRPDAPLPLPRRASTDGDARAAHAREPARDARLHDLARRALRGPHRLDDRPAPPSTDFVQLPEHKSVRVLEDNHELAAAVAPVLTPATEFFRVDIGGGVQARRLDDEAAGTSTRRRSIPLLMYVYGEPAGVEVTDKWRGDPTYRMLFHRALADAGYVVACVDNRGTPSLKGRDWRKCIYGEVGVLATADQAAAVRAHARVAAVPGSRRVSASWGWSGGGSMTLNLLFRSPDLYKVGMSVAPVPDQTLYDTIYQERYMGLPAAERRGLPEGLADHFRRGAAGQAPPRPRLRRRQRPLPGLRAAHQPARGSRQAVRLHGLPEPHALDQRGRGHLVPPARAPRAPSAGEPAGRTEVTSAGRDVLGLA